MSDREKENRRNAAADEQCQTPSGVATRGVPSRRRQSRWRSPRIGVHPIVVEIALGAALWFLAVTWLSFAWDREVDLDLAVVTLFFVIFFTLFLLTASYAVKDPRRHLRATSFNQFLESDVGTATGTMRGREVLIEIAVVPVSLALAATAIGAVWVILH